MICRLCLTKIEMLKEILLFETELNHLPSEFVPLIDKYLHLKVSWDDAISTSLCSGCGGILKDFDTFCQMVAEKQKTLENEFLSVKCDAKYWPDNEDFDSDILDEHFHNDDSDEVEEESKGNAESEEESCDKDILEEKEIKIEDFALLQPENSDRDLTAILSEDDVPLVELRKRKKSSNCHLNVKRERIRKPKVKEKSLKKAEEKKSISNQTEIIKQNEEIIASHMKLICDLCSKECETFAKLRLHFTEVHNERSAYVKCCNNKYGKPSKLVEHLKWHQNPDAYKCKLCNKKLKGQNCLDVHMTTKHSEALATELNNEEAHLACPHCPRKFRAEAFLKKHIKKHENGQVKDFNCDLCGKRFINIHRLRRHIEAIHEDLHPYVCDICGRKFKFKPSFDKHIMEHQGITEKPIQCEDCGQWLKNEHTYRWHRLTHEKKDVPCSYCGKICASKIALRAHISYMHKEKPLLQCKYCEKSFKEKKNYNEHLAVHTRALLYSCQYCGKEFRSKANMYVHVKRTHVTEWMNAKLAKSNDPNFKQNNDE